MNNSTGQLLYRLLMLPLLGFWGCYNNAHLRTQQLLEPGEKVFTGSGVLAVGGEGMFAETGISGFRGEISALTGKEAGETGVYAGLGITEAEGYDIILGYQQKRYHRRSWGRPWKVGFEGEINFTTGGFGATGIAFHLRPSLTSTTSKEHRRYVGLHGLASLGFLERRNDFFGSGPSSYQPSALGAGVTLGQEWISFSGTTSMQYQVDASWIFFRSGGSNYAPGYLDYPSGPVFIVTASAGLNLFRPPSSSRRISRPTRRPAPARAPRFQTAPPSTKQQEFDPITGEPLPQKAGPKIDPDTGLPLEPESAAPKPVRIDPDTGLPLEPEAEKPPQLQFDPVTGELVPAEPAPVRGPLVVAGTAPVSTTQQVSSLARAEAQRRHIGGAWAAGGGLLSCGGMFLGGVLGGNLLGFPGFLIGAGVGAIGASEMLAASVTDVRLPVELEAATPELQETYRQAYVTRTRALRRSSIYGGVLGVCVAAGIGVLVLIMTAF